MEKPIGEENINKPITMAIRTRKFTLAIIGLVSRNGQMVGVVYPALALVGWYVTVPISLVALLTGLIQSLGTHWGLFRNYWVFLKFLLTFVASVILVNHMPVVSKMADMVTKGKVAGPDFQWLRVQLLVHAAGGLFILIITTVLSVYKPRCKTGFGLPKNQGRPATLAAVSIHRACRLDGAICCYSSHHRWNPQP